MVVLDTEKVVHAPELCPIFAPYESTLQQALLQALNGQAMSGTLQSSSNDPDTFSGLYVNMPIRLNNQIIGAVLLMQPNHYPHGVSPASFLADVDQVILTTRL